MTIQPRTKDAEFPILDLPEELLQSIFCYVPPKTLLKEVRRVNSVFCRLATAAAFKSIRIVAPGKLTEASGAFGASLGALNHVRTLILDASEWEWKSTVDLYDGDDDSYLDDDDDEMFEEEEYDEDENEDDDDDDDEEDQDEDDYDESAEENEENDDNDNDNDSDGDTSDDGLADKEWSREMEAVALLAQNFGHAQIIELLCPNNDTFPIDSVRVLQHLMKQLRRMPALRQLTASCIPSQVFLVSLLPVQLTDVHLGFEYNNYSLDVVMALLDRIPGLQRVKINQLGHISMGHRDIKDWVCGRMQQQGRQYPNLKYLELLFELDGNHGHTSARLPLLVFCFFTFPRLEFLALHIIRALALFPGQSRRQSTPLLSLPSSIVARCGYPLELTITDEGIDQPVTLDDRELKKHQWHLAAPLAPSQQRIERALIAANRTADVMCWLAATPSADIKKLSLFPGAEEFLPPLQLVCVLERVQLLRTLHMTRMHVEWANEGSSIDASKSLLKTEITELTLTRCHFKSPATLLHLVEACPRLSNVRMDQCHFGRKGLLMYAPQRDKSTFLSKLFDHVSCPPIKLPLCLAFPVANLTLSYESQGKSLYLVVQDKDYVQGNMNIVRAFLGKWRPVGQKYATRRTYELTRDEIDWVLNQFDRHLNRLDNENTRKCPLEPSSPSKAATRAWNLLENRDVCIFTCLSLTRLTIEP
ncbi:hypothetical protein BC940DRAFT_20923 [Gongronella butleri]|nr:hypothetical protein BC940DRAFT_20923 [Gongronella butleri]